VKGFDKSQVDSKPNAKSHESNVIISSVFQNELKALETNRDWYSHHPKVSNVKIKRTKGGLGKSNGHSSKHCCYV
jgi:hypothetical protein